MKGHLTAGSTVAASIRNASGSHSSDGMIPVAFAFRIRMFGIFDNIHSCIFRGEVEIIFVHLRNSIALVYVQFERRLAMFSSSRYRRTRGKNAFRNRVNIGLG